MKVTEAFLYKWTENTTGMWYIGARRAVGCHPEDGYICSSTIVKSKIIENPGNWTREILLIGTSIQIPFEESALLVALDAANNINSYNMHNSNGKFRFPGHTAESKLRVSKQMTGFKNPMKNPVTAHKISVSKTGDKNPMKRADIRLKSSTNRKGLLLGDDNPMRRPEVAILTSGLNNGNCKGITIATMANTGEEIRMIGTKEILYHGFSPSCITWAIKCNKKHKGCYFRRENSVDTIDTLSIQLDI